MPKQEITVTVTLEPFKRGAERREAEMRFADYLIELAVYKLKFPKKEKEKK